MKTKQFAVLHTQKGSSSGGSRLGAHIDRKFIPENANPDLQNLNEHQIQTGNTMNEDIKIRLAEAGVKVRSNSVKSVNIILTGSHEQMKEIEKDPKLYRSWVDDNRKFVENEYGKENIIRFSVHRDERTPHIHCVFTPITKDGRLSAKEVIGNKTKLSKLQDKYAKQMESYGLKRGLKGSKAKHYEVSEYYARIKDPVKAILDVPERKLIEKQENYQKRVNEALKPLISHFQKTLNENKGWKQHSKEISEIRDWLKDEQTKLNSERVNWMNEKKNEKTELDHLRADINNDKQEIEDQAMMVGRLHGNEEMLRLVNRKLEKLQANGRFKLDKTGAIQFIAIEEQQKEQKRNRNTGYSR